MIGTTMLEVGGKSARLEDFTQRIKIADNDVNSEGSEFRAPDKTSSLSPREEEVIRLIREPGGITRKDVELALGYEVHWFIELADQYAE